MACLGLPDIQRIARMGVASVPGAAEHLATCVTCASAFGSYVRANRGDAGIEQLGRYQILSERGRGAFGRVFEAFDPALDRRVAIKLISSATPSSPTALADLLREAKAMAQIHHANVIPIFDVGRTDSGVFITMPIIDGETLDEWTKRQRATGNDIDLAKLVGKIAAGLSAIHAAGFVHRDIKPSNVLVSGTNAWIADLGLARRTPGNTTFTDVTVSTQITSVGGTPAYMAPECLAGGVASARSDQYALAVSVVEILAGHRPFDAPTYLALLAAARTEPPRLDGVAPRFHAALLRALQPTPEARFPSVAAFATALVAKPRAIRARYAIVAIVAIVAIIPVLAVVGFKGASSFGSRVPVEKPRVTVTPIPDPAPTPTPVVTASTDPTHPPCADRCTAEHEHAAARCLQTDPSCRATSLTAFTACDDALDAARCDRMRSQFVQACTHHEVTIDRGCVERARTCASKCTTCEPSPPMSAESCRATMLACQETAAAKVAPLEETRRRGWDDCAAANTRCRAGAPGESSCAETLRHCNTTVAAQFEHGKERVDREDHGCLVAQNECFAGGNHAECEKSAGACAASCAQTQFECLAKPAPTTDCSTVAATAFASCQRSCKP